MINSNIDLTKRNTRLYNALTHVESKGIKVVYYPLLRKVSIEKTMMTEYEATRFIEKFYAL